MKRLLFASVLSASATLLATPSIREGSVTLAQDNRLVKVAYVLDGEVGETAIVTATFMTNGVITAGAYPFAVVGDLMRPIGPGAHEFVCPADLNWPDANLAAGELSVELKAWASGNPPLYLVADLNQSTNLQYFAEEASLPGGIGHEAYRTDAIIMRRIPSSPDEWRMGWVSTYVVDQLKERAPQHYTKVTRDYYIGVFALTQGQYYKLTGSRPATCSVTKGYPDGDLKPLETVRFDVVRGSNNWPSNTGVGSDSFVGLLRTKTGVAFDFPTDSQWEYACRAGTGTTFYNGDDKSKIGEIAWITDNVIEGYSVKQPHPVGQKKPNGWGLYDMLGNTYEYVLDWYTNDLSSVEFYENSVGPTNGTERVTRSGNWTQGVGYQHSSMRSKCPPISGSANNGFRLACPCPAVAY